MRHFHKDETRIGSAVPEINNFFEYLKNGSTEIDFDNVFWLFASANFDRFSKNLGQNFSTQLGHQSHVQLKIGSTTSSRWWKIRTFRQKLGPGGRG